MTDTMKKDIQSAFFLVIIVVICILFLSSANTLYQGVLAARQRDLRMEILDTFGVSFTEQTFDSLFAKYVEIIQDGKNTYFVYKGTPKQGGIITSGAGLWGTIELLILINEEKQQIIKLQVLYHSETPGLGGRIEEDWFLTQFQNLDYSDSVKIVMKRTGARGEVDAITGATITSRSVQNIINNALERYIQTVRR